MIELQALRYSSQSDDTMSVLHCIEPSGKRVFLMYGLEDERRRAKVGGETRIPAGRYQIKLRPAGGMHQKYIERFPDFHEGMLHLQDVPGFTWIYIHPGNDDDHTAGCYLVGEDIKSNHISQDGKLTDSVMAYTHLYQMLIRHIKESEVWIEFIDYDGVAAS